MKKSLTCTCTCSCFCKLKNRPYLLFLLGLLMILILFLLRHWLAPLLLFYLLLLALIGLVALIRFIQRLLRKLCWKATADPKGQGSKGHPSSKPIYIPPHTYKRPDPMIYSQFYLMSQGLAVTWKNPDIELFDGPTAVSSNDLTPGKTYSIHARVWNGSTEAAAVNLLVRFHYLSFGAGTVKHYIGQTLVTVPVKGAPGLPAIAKHDWTTPAAGKYCIQVELVWPDDANPNNNLGQENVSVKKLNSPNATFEFTVRNDSTFRRRLTLRADSYVIPPKEHCYQQHPASGGLWQRTEPDRYARHRLALHPVPAGWQLTFTPGPTLDLAAGQEQIVTVLVTAPDGFNGQQAINVNAFDGAQLVGGVTLYAHS